MKSLMFREMTSWGRSLSPTDTFTFCWLWTTLATKINDAKGRHSIPPINKRPSQSTQQGNQEDSAKVDQSRPEGLEPQP
ncbi:hypothetical protein CR513_49767, partial [Mucuna pruriens]